MNNTRYAVVLLDSDTRGNIISIHRTRRAAEKYATDHAANLTDIPEGKLVRTRIVERPFWNRSLIGDTILFAI